MQSMNQEDPASADIQTLLDIMQRLRDPDNGCPWDRGQDFMSVAPYTLEEAYEVVDAIERNDPDELQGELGDLLFQVVFHAQLARETGWFGFGDVVRGICDKMVRRHPHVFADAMVGDAEAQTRAWERHKEQEDRAVRDSILDGVPVSHPALTRACKLQKKAAVAGFDWTDTADVVDKVAEELEELRQEITAGTDADRIRAETGDLLFAVVNLARHADVDPESALRQANRKFTRRFHEVEMLCRAAGTSVRQAGMKALDGYWEQVKQAE